MDNTFTPLSHAQHTHHLTCVHNTHTFTHAHTHMHTHANTHIAALQSVFPQTELGTFMALSKLDKEKQLKELTSIVTGIRLFNRDCGKGGEGIDNRESHDRNHKHTCTSTHSDVQCTGTLENYTSTCVLPWLPSGSLAPQWFPGSLVVPWLPSGSLAP